MSALTEPPEHLQRLPVILHTTEQAAQVLDVPQGAIARWKHRELVQPRQFITGRGRGGLVPLYDVEDLRPLAGAYHARQQRAGERT